MLEPDQKTTPPQIWLIDDSPFDLYLNSSVINFSSTGCPVSMISSGKEALEMLSANMDQLEVTSYIILLDIKMPQMDGFEFLKEFNRFPEHVRSKFSIYLLSAYLDEANELKAGELNCIKDCIHKPLSVQSLSDTIFRSGSGRSNLH